MDQRLERLEHIQKEMHDQLQAQLQEQLTKVQQEMRDQILESQRSMISQLTQFLAGGKSIAINSDPIGGVPTRGTRYYQTQQYQISTSVPINYPTGPGSNLGDNPTNPVVPDLDDIAEMENANVDLPKQLEDRCRWLEEKFKVMENTDYHCGIDTKDLSLVLDLVLPPKFKTLEFEKYNGNNCPEAHIMIFCRRMTGYVNNDQLLIHCFQDNLIGSAAEGYNQLSRAKINSWKDLPQAFMK
ncbi:uncharacterized protein LOC128043013 [Gossypium raimondii]|uniref:uncharacterized protein LOC128043013 n=1 Tax=Gossypium raimondii TaxID=29730 RepID=UPI00227A0DDC|nr:uncharacterized protein LOC128043013 [Gossypium raimondii]